MNLDYISDIKIPLKKPSYQNLRSFLQPIKPTPKNFLDTFYYIELLQLNKN